MCRANNTHTNPTTPCVSVGEGGSLNRMPDELQRDLEGSSHIPSAHNDAQTHNDQQPQAALLPPVHILTTCSVGFGFSR